MAIVIANPKKININGPDFISKLTISDQIILVLPTNNKISWKTRSSPNEFAMDSSFFFGHFFFPSTQKEIKSLSIQQVINGVLCVFFLPHPLAESSQDFFNVVRITPHL